VRPAPASPAAPRVLAVRFSSLGDLVLTTPLLRALRARYPKAEVTMVTRTEYVPLFARNPHVTEVIGYDRSSGLAALARALRSRRFTHRLDLHGSLRSRVLRWLVGGRWGGYPKRRVARAILIRMKRDVFRDRRHVAERYFDAARGLEVQPDGRPPEVFLDAAAVRAAEQFLAERGLGRHRTLAAVVPGAAHATKQWPERHWQTLVPVLVEDGMDVVVLGGAKERDLGARLAATGGPHAASAAGLFDLQGTAALMRQARCAVAGDTGTMHLATAVGTPVVLLLGPTVGAFGFLPYRARATVLERDEPCRPCSSQGGARCPLGHHRCLELLDPAQVAAAIRKLPL
jgi:heptosyltransferase-2